MNLTRILPAVLAIVLAAVPALLGQQPATFQIEFTNKNLVPSHWQIQLKEDGSGQFEADGGSPPTGDNNIILAGPVNRPVQLSPAYTRNIFNIARQHKLFAMNCESHIKVAFQGTKHFSYSGPEGQGSCEFNYSKDKQIQQLGDSLVAVETTLITGARLEKLLQHDRLGLDRELEVLVTQAKEGNAQEMTTIREILTTIANDDQVLDRARRKARQLLPPTP
jgi:hypothetical protein